MATMTATQRRRREKVAYDAFMAECPTRELVDRLSNKWLGLVMAALAEGSMRHGEIARRIAGVSQKMLTQTLRELERDGLVTREVTPSVPVKVEYELTQLGYSLLPIMRGIKDWAEGNMDEVRKNRNRYDRQQS